ncbi:transcription elongation factor S-II (TFS1) [Vairimorpha necatrix]|uniref:Transcription elongation factor S-II (TFS1) n=1 Tax=Vairimorpha necatrix TaxID=6039 RepID=A0AAX4J968_9MICR
MSLEFDDPIKNKCMKLFYNSITSNIQSYDENRVENLAYSLTKSIYENIKNEIPKVVRSKCFNLKDKNNPSLCKNVYEGFISPEEYILMSNEDMKSLDLKEIEEKIYRESLYDIQIPEIQAETDMFKCNSCGQRKTSYRQLQTRSADEPMTTFVTCVCGNKWRFC